MNTIKHIYTRKVKINPSKNQIETFDFWMRRCKYLYNVALEEKINYYKNLRKITNFFPLSVISFIC